MTPRTHRGAALRRLVALAVLVACAVVAGCGSSSSSGGGKEAKLAFIYPTTETNFAQEMALGAKAAAQDSPGVKLTESAPANVDGPKEVQLFQAATRASKDGLAYMTLTPDLFLRPLQTASQQGVSLVAVDVPVPKGAEGTAKLLIGNSNQEIGADLAKALLPKIPKDKSGEVMIGTDTPGLPVLEQRNAGFKAVLKKERPNAKPVVFDAKQSPTDNFNTWSAQVKAHPNALAYVGPGSQAAVSLTRIQQRPGQKKLVVGACDLDNVAIQGVKDGLVTALISPEHWVKGYLAIKLLAQAKQDGKKLPEGVWNSGALTVTSKNVDEIIARQKSPASRKAFFEKVVKQQLANPDKYLSKGP
jgi:ABC-type sugar transport system substrate-binding protein